MSLCQENPMVTIGFPLIIASNKESVLMVKFEFLTVLISAYHRNHIYKQYSTLLMSQDYSSIYFLTNALNQKRGHSDKTPITDHIASRHYDDLRCGQWWNSIERLHLRPSAGLFINRIHATIEAIPWINPYSYTSSCMRARTQTHTHRHTQTHTQTHTVGRFGGHSCPHIFASMRTTHAVAPGYSTLAHMRKCIYAHIHATPYIYTNLYTYMYTIHFILTIWFFILRFGDRCLQVCIYIYLNIASIYRTSFETLPFCTMK